MLQKVGTRKLQFTGKKWYQNTFDPCATSTQIEQLEDNMKTHKIVSSVWARWRLRYHKKVEERRNQKLAFMILQNRENREKMFSKNRGAQIWIAENKVLTLQQQIIHRVVLRMFDRRRLYAFR